MNRKLHGRIIIICHVLLSLVYSQNPKHEELPVSLEMCMLGAGYLGKRRSPSQQMSSFFLAFPLGPHVSQATAAFDPGDGRSSVILRDCLR